MDKYTGQETCAKCGYTSTTIRYDAGLDQITVTCSQCAATWNVRPRDSLP